jgi:glycine hydroxymethyltransferase
MKDSLQASDPAIFKLIQEEVARQEYGLELIPSENFVSESVLQVAGSVLTNKYAEGLPGKRYYGGCEVVDEIERVANERAKQLFGAEHVNCQPHSGASANRAVYHALLEPGDTILGMRLDQGGHLTHGSPVNFSGKFYKAVSYGVTPNEHLIDFLEVERLAKEHQPKMIIAGASSYSRHIDFARFSEIAKSVGAYLMADVSHYAGLIVGGVYPNPVPHCDIVTTTTHKTLRGPRGGIIMCKEGLGKKIDKAVFPGEQGGPLMHIIAAKAVAFGEALRPEFKKYAENVVANARHLSAVLKQGGLDIVSGGSDSHMFVVDLRPKNLTGKVVQETLDLAGITCNKNAIPFDPVPPMVTSGIRIGTPAITTRGMGIPEMDKVGDLILQGLEIASKGEEKRDHEALKRLKGGVKELALKFPLYGHHLVG